MAARAIFTVLAGVCSVVAWAAEAGGPTPRDLWERVLPTLPPLEFAVEKDEAVASDTEPGRSFRRVQVRFTSQVVKGRSMGHTAVIFIPAGAAARPESAGPRKVVIVGQRWNDASMLFNYGDAIAARTGHPCMVVPVPGDCDGLDGEGRWIQILGECVRETQDPAYHNYFRLAIPYLRGVDIMAKVLGAADVRAVIGGHSKRATSAYTAAAIDPGRIAGVVYMGNESCFSFGGTEVSRAISPAYSQRQVACPVLYIGATNEDGYEMFNINRIQAIMERPWTIAYVPNYRHATASEQQFACWQMWVAHVFDGRPVAVIDGLRHETNAAGTRFHARVVSPNKIIQVKFWYTYCDDIPYWRDLVWYPIYPAAAGGGAYEGFLDGKTPDAWFVEVKDTAQGLPGYISSLPQDITHLPTKERISHGWRSRQWEPATAPKAR